MRRRADEEGNKQRPPGSVGPGGSEKRRTSVNLQVIKRERKRKDMKKFRKLLSLGLATAMTMAMAAPSYAASITIDNALNGETYTVYKIFDVTKADTDNDGTEDAFAYSIKSALILS